MAKVHAYLNFNGNCEQAFQFYQTVFGGPLLGVHRFGDMPADLELQLKIGDFFMLPFFLFPIASLRSARANALKSRFNFV